MKQEFPLFETICIKQGEVKNIALHQQRYQRSLQQFYQQNTDESAVQIYDLLSLIRKNPEFPTALQLPICRCRLSYNATSYYIEFFEYQPRSFKSFTPVICEHIDYGLKYQDRRLLNQLLDQRNDADEIIIIKQGKVTDCSIGNLIFRKGQNWFTSDSPLLEGTQRNYLLQQGKIHLRTIWAEEIADFDEIRVINAMNTLD